jgi:AraC-like DNA-binding protein
MKITRTPKLEKVAATGPRSFAVRKFDLAAFDYPWHQHPEVELTWILEGSGHRHVGDSVEPFSDGDFCLLGANLPHTWLTTGSGHGSRARSFVIQFDPMRLGAGLLQLPETARIARLLDRAAHGLCFDSGIGERLRQRLEKQESPLRQLTTLLEVLDELADLNEARSLSLAAWTQRPRTEADPRMRRVLAYLAENVDQTIAQAEAARRAGLSPAAFSRFFRRAMGKTFQSYITDLRLSLVCRQLLETDRTVSEIAFAAGFGNLSNFNRSFRLSCGMSPRDFRRQGLRVLKS